MNFTKLFLIGLSLSIAVTAQSWAGGKGGNGGNGVVCFDKPELAQALLNETNGKPVLIPDTYIEHITSIEALDLHRAKASKKLGSKEETKIHPVSDWERSDDGYAISRILKLQPYAWEMVSELIDQDFWLTHHVQVFHEAGLFPVDDITPPNALGESCVTATVIAQRPMRSGAEQMQLFIDGRLYEHKNHSQLSKGVFWLHEILLADANSKREQNNLPYLTNTDDVSTLVGYLIMDYPVDLNSILNLKNWLLVDYEETDHKGKSTVMNRWHQANQTHATVKYYYGSGGFGSSVISDWLKSIKIGMELSFEQAWKTTQQQQEYQLQKVMDLLPSWYHPVLQSKKEWILKDALNGCYGNRCMPRTKKTQRRLREANKIFQTVKEAFWKEWDAELAKDVKKREENSYWISIFEDGSVLKKFSKTLPDAIREINKTGRLERAFTSRNHHYAFPRLSPHYERNHFLYDYYRAPDSGIPMHGGRWSVVEENGIGYIELRSSDIIFNQKRE